MARSQASKKYSFRSVGETQQERTQRINAVVNEIPIGIRTPIQLGTGNSGLFQMHNKLLDQLADNMRNLINTNHGERVGLYDFGANLEPLTFELGAENGDVEAMRRIGQAVAKYMPYVELLDFEPLIDRVNNKDVAKIIIRVTYTVPILAPKVPMGVEVMLYCAG